MHCLYQFPHRSFVEYQGGFHDGADWDEGLTKSHWIGLNQINSLTNSGTGGGEHGASILHIDLEFFDGRRLWARYEQFSVGGVLSNFR